MRVIFLEKAEQGTGRDDGENDGRVDPILGDSRNNCGKEEDKDDRILKLIGENPQAG
jgi:hypothetical protein